MTPNPSERGRLANHSFAPATPAAAVAGATAALPLMTVLPRTSIKSAVQHTLLRAVETASAWHGRTRQRRALRELSDHMLRDIGMDRAAALAEATKPFWRA
jgi:uncharacterized protein YjiS (DUF1127 family)